VIRVEALAWDFAEPEPVLQIADDGLDLRAVVVLDGDLLGWSEPIVGDIELHGLTGIVPDAELLPRTALRRAQGDHSEWHLALDPFCALEREHRDALGWVIEGVAIGDAPALVRECVSEERRSLTMKRVPESSRSSSKSLQSPAASMRAVMRV